LSDPTIKTLFTTEDGLWSVTHEIWNDPGNEDCVSACHINCPYYGAPGITEDTVHRDASWFIGEDAQCWSCQAPVPDEIQVIYKLYEYGRGALWTYPDDYDGLE
jgi:NAD-dependent dihydropyrimidine dehydrogenase PreA subunit